MTHPYDLGPQADPHPTDYKPRELRDRDEDTMTPKSHDVIAAQELLDFMRFRGYGAQSIVVGTVQIVGLTDLYPRKPIAPSKPTDADLYDEPGMGR